jgi:hypothetical protein
MQNLLMKYILILFAIYSFSSIISSCGTNEKKHTENTSTAIDYEVIKKGVLHGAGEEGISQSALMISNYEDYSDIRDKVNSVNQELKENLVPDSDFFEEQVLIFIFDKVRRTGGYSLRIEQTVLKNDTLIITALSQSPGDPATSIMTQPFQVLKLQKIDKEVKLEVTE